MTKYKVEFADQPHTTIEADGFNVYDRGDLIFFVKSPTDPYDTDNIAAFAAGGWTYVQKAASE